MSGVGEVLAALLIGAVLLGIVAHDAFDGKLNALQMGYTAACEAGGGEYGYVKGGEFGADDYTWYCTTFPGRPEGFVRVQ